MTEGREPIRRREYVNGMRTNKEPSGKLQGGSYISPQFPCLVTSAPEDGDSMFL
jgi:hypothetical protein